jgi:hypothetical protein
MKKGQGSSISRESGADRVPTNAIAAQTRQLLAAVAVAREGVVLSAQERRALVKLINALANLLGETPKDA